MKRLASTFPNMLLSLTLVAMIAGAILGYIYKITEKPIAEMAEKTRIDAIKAVAPAFNNNPLDDKVQYNIDGIEYTVYPAIMDGKLVGAAVQTSSDQGFGGIIEIMCGFDQDGTVRDYEVISHAETPGLGSKMQEWFRDPRQARSILLKNPSTTSFYVVKDTEHNGQIDGITAATISSRAFLSAVRNAYDVYMRYKNDCKPAADCTDANSGATTQDANSGATTQDANSGATHQGEGKTHNSKTK